MLACVLAWCSCAFALNPDLDISQYAHTSWKIRDGFAKGTITSIAQTPDGYLWRAAALTRFVEEEGGVYMEMETIGLSRPFPLMMGWMIEPIARRIGRRSVERSVEEFRQAVLKRYPTTQ